jgi:hypothetical protein
MTSVFRDYECDGLCGTVIPIPADCAATVLYPNGNKRPNAFIACGACQIWLDDATNEAEFVGVVRGELHRHKKGDKLACV